MTELKPGWKMVKFGDIAQSIAVRVNPADAKTDIYVGLEHLDPSTLHLRQWGHPSDVTGQKLAFKKGDVIFGRRRAYQRKLAVAEFDGICSAHAMVVRAKSKMILPEFLPFFLKSDMFMERAIEISVGSLSPTINWKTLREQVFPLPPLDAQKRIAEILWAADEAVEQYKYSRQKASRLLEAMRNHEVCSGNYPWKKFGTVLKSIVAGKSVVGVNTPAEPHEYGVLKISAVGANGFEPDENKRLINSTDFLSQYSVNKSALLITRCNTTDLVGRVCLTPEDYPNLMLCDKTLNLVVDASKANKRFMFEALRARPLRNQLTGCATGTGGAMKNISQQDIRSLSVPLPPRDIQKTIALRCASVDQRIEELTRQINTLRILTKQLSNELIHGGGGADHV
jgi:type I restriction enzyme, S subunit